VSLLESVRANGVEPRTETYIRQNSSTQQEAVKRILDSKSFQNTERLADIQERAKQLLAGAQLIINAADIEAPSTDGQTRILKGFYQLIETTYSEPAYVAGCALQRG